MYTGNIIVLYNMYAYTLYMHALGSGVQVLTSVLIWSLFVAIDTWQLGHCERCPAHVRMVWPK